MKNNFYRKVVFLLISYIFSLNMSFSQNYLFFDKWPISDTIISTSILYSDSWEEIESMDSTFILINDNILILRDRDYYLNRVDGVHLKKEYKDKYNLPFDYGTASDQLILTNAYTKFKEGKAFNNDRVVVSLFFDKYAKLERISFVGGFQDKKIIQYRLILEFIQSTKDYWIIDSNSEADFGEVRQFTF